MSHPIRVLLVGALSLVVGLAVALVVSQIEIVTDVALYGFSAAVVIPVGAIGCGLVAALGFYGASRALHVRPAGFVLGIPLVTAVATFFASHWFTFSRYELPTGRTFREAMALDGLGFVDYLRLTATESGLTLGSSSAPTTIGRLGAWGYGVAAIEILGFALGGWSVSTILRRKPWCGASHRFMRQQGSHTSYFEDPDRFESFANHLVDVLERGGAVAAFEHAAAGKPMLRNKRKALFAVKTKHFDCASCWACHTVISTQHLVNSNWTQLSQTPLHLEDLPVDDQSAPLVGLREGAR